MSERKITEEQLHLVNTALAEHDDTISRNLMTRTAQESKLFPMLPYFMMSFIQAYYMYPNILRKASEHLSPEDIGHRMRTGHRADFGNHHVTPQRFRTFPPARALNGPGGSTHG